jgi:hypothetical protein
MFRMKELAAIVKNGKTQNIPFIRWSRALIGPEYSGASEERLFLLQVRGRNSIECAKVPRLVVLRLR